jgi:hypothetical protein
MLIPNAVVNKVEPNRRPTRKKTLDRLIDIIIAKGEVDQNVCFNVSAIN